MFPRRHHDTGTFRLYPRDILFIVPVPMKFSHPHQKSRHHDTDTFPEYFRDRFSIVSRAPQFSRTKGTMTLAHFQHIFEILLLVFRTHEIVQPTSNSRHNDNGTFPEYSRDILLTVTRTHEIKTPRSKNQAPSHCHISCIFSNYYFNCLPYPQNLPTHISTMTLEHFPHLS